MALFVLHNKSADSQKARKDPLIAGSPVVADAPSAQRPAFPKKKCQPESDGAPTAVSTKISKLLHFSDLSLLDAKAIWREKRLTRCCLSEKAHRWSRWA